MTKIITAVLVVLMLVIMFVAPVRTALNNLSRKQEVREEALIGTVATFNPKVKEIQKTLHLAGYSPGLIDGSMGENTRSALKLFQEAHGLKPTGWIDAETLDAVYAVKKLVDQPSAPVSPELVAPAEPAAPPREITTRQIQEILRAQGFYTGPVDGKIGKRTIDAVKKFQSANGLKEDGVLGSATKEKLLSWLDEKT